MKPKSTLFLKLVITGMGLFAVGIVTLMAVNIVREGGFKDPYSYILYPLVICMFLAAVPFLIGLFQGWKLLTYIDNNIAFSTLSITALKNIKYCAMTTALLYTLGTPFLFMLTQLDDAPGIVLLGFIFTGASIVIATFAAVLEKLFQSAIDLKAENDLTV